MIGKQQDRDGYTFDEAAARIGVSAKTLKRDAADGKLVTTKRGGKWYVAREEWQQYLARCRWDSLSRPEQIRKIREATLPPNPAHDALLDDAALRANRKPFPYCGPAVYFLYHGKEIVYIGKTTNLWSRMSSHHGQKVFDHFSYLACVESELDELERRAILKYRPKLNRA